MKKGRTHGKWQLLLVLAFGALLSAGMPARAATVTAQPEQTTTEKEESGITDETGTIIQGWDKTKTSYYENGKAVTGVKAIGDALYYFDERGKLYTKKGMQEIAGKYYYFNKNHTMKTGVVKVKKKYYYYQKKTGERYEETGVQKVDNKYYCFGKNHELKSGWYRDKKNNRYYFDKKTFAAYVGWQYIGKYKFYFEKSGQLCQDLRSKWKKKIKRWRKSSDAYKIMVNRTGSCVTVYAKDGDNGYTIPVVAFVCSAGKGTPVGDFTIRDKLRWHELMGPSWGQWCEHLTEDILFHSVFYNQKNDNRTLDVPAYNKLGTMASHGCVRLTAGDAKWIYDNCAVGTKVTIYNNKKNPGPFDKPKAQKLSSKHTWDPTDPNIK